MSRGFARSQLERLARPLEQTRIQAREAHGKTLRYIEGRVAIQEANAIFGYAGWDREVVHFEKLYEHLKGCEYHCAYLARVKITVRAGNNAVIREGTGFGAAQDRDLSLAHERALKAAETDATKRALITFGSRFGLSPYEKDRADAQSVDPHKRFVLFDADGGQIASGVSPEAFCSGLRQLIEATATVPLLRALQQANQAMIQRLRVLAPDLRSGRGIHFADILESLISKRLDALAFAQPQSGGSAQALAGHDAKRAGVHNEETSSPSQSEGDVVLPPTVPSQKEADGAILSTAAGQAAPPTITLKPSRIGSGAAIQKSELSIASDRRIRDKAHLIFVASKPCLVCEELPAHAHHITYAQRHGLALKVSDEFTVPLCAVHHNAVHRAPSERAWWREQAIDPLQQAAVLWMEHLRQTS